MQLSVVSAINRSGATIEQLMASTSRVDVEVDNYSFKIWRHGKVVAQYDPDITALKFHKCKDFVRLQKGPIGSGKSVSCVADMIFQTVDMPVCIDGIRRTRFAVIRNTYNDLSRTTFNTIDAWLDNLGDVTRTKQPIYRFYRFNDGHGECHLELYALALDRPDQARALMSLELTGAYFNELNFIQQDVFEKAQGRVGRYPSKALCLDDYFSGIIADCNPPDTDHWLYQTFEENINNAEIERFDKEVKLTTKIELDDGAIKDIAHHLFNQPPGLIKTERGWKENPNRENKKWLPPDYYTRLTANKTHEYIKVYCLGEYGIAAQGVPIFPNYNDDWHGADNLEYNPKMPLHLGFDFGLTPACIISQVYPDGRVFVLGECTCDWMDLQQFESSVLRPYLSMYFPNYILFQSMIDPAGVQHAQTDGQSCFILLNKLGYKPRPAASNDLGIRFNAVNILLDTNVSGKPRFQIDRKKCPVLRKALIDGYQRKEMKFVKHPDGTPVFDEKPYKNKYSHPAEAFQYLAMGINGNAEKPKIDKSRLINVRPTEWC